MLLARIVNDDDVRMREPRQRPGLLLEARNEVLVGGIVGRQNLDGDIAIEMLLTRAIDTRHAALAEQIRDDTTAQALANEIVVDTPGCLLISHAIPSALIESRFSRSARYEVKCARRAAPATLGLALCGRRALALEDQRRLPHLHLVAILQQVVACDPLAIDVG